MLRASKEIRAESLEGDLLLRENQEVIAGIVGESYANSLRELAIEASQNRSRTGRRVLILPGILGSTLAVNGDTVWFDPIDIARGKLKLLALSSGLDNVVSNGVFWPSYAELFLKLRIAGFRPEYFHFDWRKPISEAGRQLAKKVRAISSDQQPVSLVAHSMGGLVCRSALKILGAQSKKLVSQTILLGTPNLGSYAPAMVFTGDYSTVEWMERLDLVNPSGSLVSDVFTTFVGLAEMLPDSSLTNGIDLFDVNSYPPYRRVVRKSVLEKAKGLQARLAGGSDRLWMFAGVGLESVVGLQSGWSELGKFRFQKSMDGDGTVPRSLAFLQGAHHRYCEVSHGALPRDSEVIQATIDILRSGATTRLSATPQAGTRSVLAMGTVSSPGEQSRVLLRRAVLEGRSGESLSNIEVYSALDAVLSTRLNQTGPNQVDTENQPQEIAFLQSEQPLILGRKNQTRLDLRLVLGDVSETHGRAIMLGFFKDVRPSGAAGALDSRLEGMLAEIIDRRMFSANIGEVFILPTPRHGLKAEMVVLIGLGTFEQFSMQSLRSSVENAVRTLLRCNVDELVTVPLGGGSGLRMDHIAEAMIEGVNSAIKDARGRPSLRSLVITTINKRDHDELCRSTLLLAASDKFGGVEFTVEREVQERGDRGQGSPATELVSTRATTYLFVRETPNPQSANKGHYFVDVSILGTGAKATVLSGSVKIPANDLKQLLFRINDAKHAPGFFGKATTFGQQLSDLVLPSMIREFLARSKPESVTVINDLWGSKIPWELLMVSDWKAGLSGNLSRKYSTENISVAKWLQSRRRDKSLEMLLVVDPTEDLPNAKTEAARIVKIVESQRAMNLTQIVGTQATKDRLASEFTSGKYDVVHYAGHAYFDDRNRSQSGLLCADQKVLSGRELATLDSLPALVVFNACESARVRSATLPTSIARGRGNTKRIAPIDDLVDRNVSLAEAFLRGGVASFVGTYWPVKDSAADMFARAFYTSLISGRTIGESLFVARKSLFESSEADWLNYIHYGDTAFKVKVG